MSSKNIVKGGVANSKGNEFEIFSLFYIIKSLKTRNDMITSQIFLDYSVISENKLHIYEVKNYNKSNLSVASKRAIDSARKLVGDEKINLKIITPSQDKENKTIFLDPKTPVKDFRNKNIGLKTKQKTEDIRGTIIATFTHSTFFEMIEKYLHSKKDDDYTNDLIELNNHRTGDLLNFFVKYCDFEKVLSKSKKRVKRLFDSKRKNMSDNEYRKNLIKIMFQNRVVLNGGKNEDK